MLKPSDRNVSRRDVLAGAAAIAAVGVATHAYAAASEGTSADAPAIHNNRINQTLCKWCYTKLSLEELCQAAVKLGYKGIDLVGPETFPMLKKYNLVGTMTPSHKIEKGINRKENWDYCLGLIRKGIDASSEAGFPNVICFSGNRAGMDLDEGMSNCAEALKQVVGQAEAKKVTICMELLNSRVNHKDYMADHSAWGVQLVKKVGSDRFKLLYDIYHMQIMEGDVIRTIKENKDYFGHYHTAGVPGRHEIDDSQELYYPAVMKAIVETGYKGYVGQEFLPVHDTVTSIAQAARICDV
ncbi:MAG TPA: TIM barrel protein [Tepidisphaeraceae bacterium]|nr:TIM barrel protein [Tepidisphaeraceae bacterium]